jgi:hypothetical protein
MREIEKPKPKLKPNPKPAKAIEEDRRKDGKGGGAWTRLQTHRSVVIYYSALVFNFLGFVLGFGFFIFWFRGV